MKRLVATLAALVALASQARADEAPPPPLQISPLLGALLPSGHGRALFDDAVLLGLTAAFDVHRNVALVAALGWAQTQGHGFAAPSATLDVLQYDLGAQLQLPIGLRDGQTLKPFVGAGVGGRTYHFRDLNVERETDLVAYGSLGVALECRGFAVGVTARTYLSDFDGIGAKRSATWAKDLALFGSIGTRF